MDMAEAFTKALGKPDPATSAGLQFEGFSQRIWEQNAEKLGAGFFRDRFLYLFGEGMAALKPCLDAWSFLIPPNAERMIVGRNAYGAIAFVDNANQVASKLYVVDPLTVDLISDDGLDLWRFIGRYLPENLIENFLADGVYRRWLAENQLALELDMALAITTPLTLGGKMELDNFSVENIVAYYQSTAPIYAKGIGQRQG